ncbi:MAG: ExbD/TolR family protein [Burkholderiales bacterium]
MAFGSFDNSGHTRQNAEINVVPLIDVMLVLLVIFIITAPLLTNAVKLDLPTATSNVNQIKRENLQIAIGATGQLFWNGEMLDRASLQTRLAQSSKQEPQPEIQLRADKAVPYQRVAEVLSDAARVGMTRIGFVTDPNE